MIRFVLLAMMLLMFAMIAVALLLSFLVVVAMACAVGIPLWLMSKQWMSRHGVSHSVQNPVERLQNLYVEGKIDLFEFERRVAHLISAER